MEKKTPTPMMLSDLIVELCALMNNHGNVGVYVCDTSSAENPVGRVVGVGSLDFDRGDDPVKIATIDIHMDDIDQGITMDCGIGEIGNLEHVGSDLLGVYLPDAEGEV